MKIAGYKVTFFVCCMIALSWIAFLAPSCAGCGNRKLTRADSLYNSGEKFYNEKQYLQAFALYLKAARAGHTLAMNQVGWMYQRGEGITIDYQKAMEWYQKAASHGNSSAMTNIWWLYDKGEGVPEDNVKAVEWYNKGVAAGNTSAVYDLAWMYEYGEGVARDYPKAMAYYQQAAREESVEAMNRD